MSHRIVDSIAEQTILRKILTQQQNDPYNLAGVTQLDEVEVSDYRISDYNKDMVALHGIPDVVIGNKELMGKEKNWTGTIFPWLLFNKPNDIRIKRLPKLSARFYRFSTGPSGRCGFHLCGY